MSKKWVWLAMDRGDRHSVYLWTKCSPAPIVNEIGDWERGGEWLGYDLSFCKPLFSKATGFKIKPGECKKVEIHIKEID